MLWRLTIAFAAVFAASVGATSQDIFRPASCGSRRWIPYDPASMSFGLTPEQAAERVRTWMQEPDLQLQVVGVATDRTDDYLQLNPWPAWEWELQYMLEGSDGKHYFVRIHPWVSVAYWDTSADTPRGTDPGLYLSDAQRQAVAEAFARARTPNLWGAPHMQEHYGRVMACYNGVRHPLRSTAASVHPETGALITCVMTDPGVPAISLSPAVSEPTARQMAIASLLQATDYTGVVTSDAGNRTQHLLVASDPLALVHRLAWSVPLAATRDNPPTQDGIWYEHDVYVDAHTGESFHIESYVGAESPTPKGRIHRRTGMAASLPLPLGMTVGDREVITAMPPLLIHGKPYLWAGWLRNALIRGDGTAVEYAAGQLTLARGGIKRIVPLKAEGPGNTPTARDWTGGYVVGNRCYVPLETVRALVTMSVVYESRSRTVRFGSHVSALRSSAR